VRETPDAARRAFLIEDAHQALATRVGLIDAADQAIDAQYFIWQNDATGILVIDRLLAAADRGVRVRALVDDALMEGLTGRLMALDSHPNIEVRVFNPFSLRVPFPPLLLRAAEFVIDGGRLNHRMHNKLLVVDGQLAILGGRNIGDDYFGFSPKRRFIDTDILLSGDIVRELDEGFETYWHSRWAYPASAFVNLSPVAPDLATVRRRIRERLSARPGLQSAGGEAAFEDTIRKLSTGPQVRWSATIIDDPDVPRERARGRMAVDLTEFALNARCEVLVVSPYLIPTPKLLDIARTLTARGVKVSVLTNSLATNDLVIAHAGYARFRRDILDAGVELYELRPDAARFRDGQASRISLHSKYIVLDRETVYVGSLNLDPRSIYLNTELGVVLESPALAGSLRASFLDMVRPQNAWRVIDTAGGLRWRSDAGTLERQPATGPWQRLRDWMWSLLPLSGQV